MWMTSQPVWNFYIVRNGWLTAIFTTISHWISPNLIESHRISPPVPNLTISLNLTEFYKISPYLTEYHHRSLNLTVSHCISLYLTEVCQFSPNIIESHHIWPLCHPISESDPISSNFFFFSPYFTISHWISPTLSNLTESHHILLNFTISLQIISQSPYLTISSQISMNLAKSCYISQNLTKPHHISPTLSNLAASHRSSLNFKYNPKWYHTIREKGAQSEISSVKKWPNVKLNIDAKVSFNGIYY